MRILGPWKIAACLAVGIGLLSPSSASAVEVWGSSLAAPPTPGLGCNTKPALLDSSGQLYQVASNTADCTWWQAAVPGNPNDPRHGGVPVTGTITSLTVISGPNPSPLRVVVVRQLGAAGNGSECCFFVQETPPLQPTPNTTTAFPLNLHVAHASAVGGIRADDYVGISGQGDGGLPLRIVGSTNVLFPDLQAPHAAFLYPRFGSLPNDPGGGRREEGAPGVELLTRWTLCADGDATCAPAGNAISGQAAPPNFPALAAQLARIRNGSALIKLLCKGNLLCEGQLELINLGGVAKKKKVTVYGKKTYKINPGGKLTLKVKLNKKGKKLLKKKKQVKIGVRMTQKAGGVTTSRLTLKKR